MGPDIAYIDLEQGFTLDAFVTNFTGVTYKPNEAPMVNPFGDIMQYQGMWRCWLATCWAGSLLLLFGSVWLYDIMILWAFIIVFVFEPTYTSCMIFVIYNQPNSNQFTTWWYAAINVFQFFVGLGLLYMYAWLKAELEMRNREEIIKLEQGKLTKADDCASLKCYPCMCRIEGDEMKRVIKRYDNMHQIDIRSNILCPKCKNRIELILM